MPSPRTFEAPRTLDTPKTATGTLASPHLHASPVATAALEHRQRWERSYRLRLFWTDLAIVLVSVGIAAWVQINTIAQVDLVDAPWQYGRVSMATAAIWLILLALFQSRGPRVLGHGMTEYKRVVHATGLAFGVLAIAFVIMQSQGIRTQLLIALPLGIVGVVLGRWMWRRWLQGQRVAGRYVSRALVVGNRHDVEYVLSTLQTEGLMAYHVVGVTLDSGDEGEIIVGDAQYRAHGDLGAVAARATVLGADAVILASTPEADRGYIKRLSWQLEGTAAELVLSSPLVDVAGPRMSLKPMEGLPLIQVEIPTFEGGRHLTKRAFDVALSFVASVFIGLATPFIALAIKLDSRGPVFFTQKRVGRDGVEFSMLKFRSMHVNAESQLEELMKANEGSGPLFKMKSDPRVTRVGAFLRKYSLDELPQFFNVFLGHMSIVGPRPPLPAETKEYGGSTHRRLFIKPGITGPWQVSGRSHLSWEESVRLDLRYVENWSVMSDFVLLWRTVGSVLKADGAY